MVLHPALANDCSWHQTVSWAGAPFLTIHNEFITLITTEQRLATALQSLRDLLFYADNTGYSFFNSVVTRRFKFGHVHVSHMAMRGKQMGMASRKEQYEGDARIGEGGDGQRRLKENQRESKEEPTCSHFRN